VEVIALCQNVDESIEAIQRLHPDVVFLDIQLQRETGFDLLTKLKHFDFNVVFTTAYSEYALESYELDVVDYLLKPITFTRFLQAVDKVNSRINSAAQIEKVVPNSSQPFIFIKDGTKLVKVMWADILYIEGLKDYVTIHTKQQKVVSLQRLKSLEEQLPAEQFIRIHNSFIVSLHAIESIHKNEVHIGTAALPISDSYRKSFRDFIEKNHLQ